MAGNQWVVYERATADAWGRKLRKECPMEVTCGVADGEHAGWVVDLDPVVALGGAWHYGSWSHGERDWEGDARRVGRRER